MGGTKKCHHALLSAAERDILKRRYVSFGKRRAALFFLITKKCNHSLLSVAERDFLGRRYVLYFGQRGETFLGRRYVSYMKSSAAPFLSGHPTSANFLYLVQRSETSWGCATFLPGRVAPPGFLVTSRCKHFVLSQQSETFCRRRHVSFGKRSAAPLWGAPKSATMHYLVQRSETS